MDEIDANELFEPSKETLILEKYIADKRAENKLDITYMDIFDETKIDIQEPANRAKFYTACKRLGETYLTIKGFGYQLSSPDNALLIVDDGINKILSRSKATVTNITLIKDKHDQTLTPYTKEVLDTVEIGCKIIMCESIGRKSIIRKEIPKLSKPITHVKVVKRIV